MHAPSTSTRRNQFWDHMRSDLPSNSPWLVLGDMNEFISQSEKMGGRPVRSSQGRNLINFMDDAGLVDIGYNGCKYTWTNARDGIDLIQERLDRALANSPWMDNFPHTKVHHLPRIHSDHSPILISLHNSFTTGSFPFRLKKFGFVILIFLITLLIIGKLPIMSS